MRNINSLAPFVQIVDDLIGKTFHDLNGGQLFRNNTPGLNVVDTGKEFKLELAAPGLNKQDFKIELENNLLVISADKNKKTRNLKKVISEKNSVIIHLKECLNFRQKQTQKNYRSIRKWNLEHSNS